MRLQKVKVCKLNDGQKAIVGHYGDWGASARYAASRAQDCAEFQVSEAEVRQVYNYWYRTGIRTTNYRRGIGKAADVVRDLIEGKRVKRQRRAG